MGDNGISLQVGGGINDPDERLQLFADLIYVLKANDGFTVERFASNKGYSLAQIEKMVKYYRKTRQGINPIDELRQRLFVDENNNYVFKMQMGSGGLIKQVLARWDSKYEVDYIVFTSFKTALNYAINYYGIEGFSLHHLNNLHRNSALEVINKYIIDNGYIKFDFGDLLEWEMFLGKKYMEKDGKFGFY